MAQTSKEQKDRFAAEETARETDIAASFWRTAWLPFLLQVVTVLFLLVPALLMTFGFPWSRWHLLPLGVGLACSCAMLWKTLSLWHQEIATRYDEERLIPDLEQRINLVSATCAPSNLKLQQQQWLELRALYRRYPWMVMTSSLPANALAALVEEGVQSGSLRPLTYHADAQLVKKVAMGLSREEEGYPLTRYWFNIAVTKMRRK